MSEMTSTKSYVIAKRAVWEAYQQVKANRGSAGIDGESIAMFDGKLSRNLYKLWNRMSSGWYFPPPVKQVEQWARRKYKTLLRRKRRSVDWLRKMKDETPNLFHHWSVVGNKVG